MSEIIPVAWLRRRISVGEAEHENMLQDSRLGPEPLPFGFCYGEWQRLRNQMREGDELWEFSSSGDSWKHLAGRAGLALTRNGEVISSFTTVMS